MGIQCSVSEATATELECKAGEGMHSSFMVPQ